MDGQNYNNDIDYAVDNGSGKVSQGIRRHWKTQRTEKRKKKERIKEL